MPTRTNVLGEWLFGTKARPLPEEGWWCKISRITYSECTGLSCYSTATDAVRDNGARERSLEVVRLVWRPQMVRVLEKVETFES